MPAHCRLGIGIILVAMVGTSAWTAQGTSARTVSAPARPVRLSTIGAYALGDSVMLGAQPELQKLGITVNAVVSRQFYQGIYIIQAMRAAGQLPREVVIGLGTNGPFTAAQFDEMMRSLQSQTRVVFVTVKEPRFWEAQVNQTIRAGKLRWKNVRIAPWYSRATQHPSWICCDGIHLDAAGAQGYALMIAKALTKR